MEAFVTSATGVRSPRIIYGTAWKKERTARLVTTALEIGFRGIDTACQPRHYDEPGVGAGIAAALGPGLDRTDIYLQTKFTPLGGHDPQRIPYDPDASLPEQVLESCGVSLRNLRTGYLDCLILHSPLPTLRQTFEAWYAMESLVKDGRVRQLGISNCYRLDLLQALYEGAHVKPAVVQNRFYEQTRYDRDIRAWCRRQNVIYQSFWTLTANPHVLASDTVQALAAKHRRTAPQILFRYLTQIGVVPLTGTSSVQHMREDLAIFEFTLTEEELAAMGVLF